jgi:peptide/nickel transport system substrate-binding protein
VFNWEPGPLTSTTPFLDKDLRNYYAHDPANANQLLDAAGWTQRDADGFRTKDGKQLAATVIYSSDPGDSPPTDVTLYQDIQAAEKEIASTSSQAGPAGPVLRRFHRQERLRRPGGVLEQPGTVGAHPAVLHRLDEPGTGQRHVLGVEPGHRRATEGDRAASEVEQQKHLYDQVQQLVAQSAYHLGLYPQTTRLVSKAPAGRLDRTVRG